jgi:ERF superfamily
MNHIPVTDAPVDNPPLTAPAPAGGASYPPSAGATDPYLSMIERAARDPAVDLPKLEGLMSLRERIEDRRAKQAFDNAIALAKGEIGPIAKNREVDFTSSKGRTHYRYEDFAGVAATVDPVLARHGLSYRFRSEQAGQKLRVTCRISHADGYGEETTLEANNDESGNKNSIQSVGSAATYLQRYTLKLALGLAASNDDDTQHVRDDDPAISIDDIVYVETLVRDTDTDLAKLLKHVGAASVAEFTQSQYKKAIAGLNVKKRQAAKP